MRKIITLLAVCMLMLFVSSTSAGFKGPQYDSIIDLNNTTTQQNNYLENVTIASGISATHNYTAKYWGVGQAWGDFDKDGYDDLYVTNQVGENTLYRNKGDGTFEISEFSSQVKGPDYPSGGAVFADYNNDGYLDLYLTSWGKNTLYRNDKGKGFTEVAAEAGVDQDGKGSSASFGDVNNDGYLDLYVANWYCELSKCSEGSTDAFYLNNGNGTFRRANDLLQTSPGAPAIDQLQAAGFTGQFLDYDNDGDLDIYVANDQVINPVGNMLWKNEGDYFIESSFEAGLRLYMNAMGIGISDFDLDGDLDMMISNMMQPKLMINNGNGTFYDGTVEANIIQKAPEGYMPVTWGTIFADFNNDGYDDLVMADHFIGSHFYLNNGDGTFTDKTTESGISVYAQGVSASDYDKDGKIDLVFNPRVGDVTLYNNRMDTGDYIRIKLDASKTSMNQQGIGSRVILELSDDRVLLKELRIGTSLGGGNENIFHFGLGTAKIKSAILQWSNGENQLITDEVISGVNSEISIVYDANKLISNDVSSTSDPVNFFSVMEIFTAGLLIIFFKKKK